MPIPFIALAAGALFGAKNTKQKSKKDFQAVKGRKKKDGTIGKPYIRKKAKSK